MNFHTEWERLCKKSIDKGSFEYSHKSPSFASLLRKESVSEGYGVYAIHGIYGIHSELIYIGMAGTIKKDSVSKQGLRKRLNRIAFKVKGITVARRDVFKFLLGLPIDESKAELIKQRYPEIQKYEELHFKWIETYPKIGNPPPILSEKALLEAFHNENKRLPIMNKRM